MSAMTSARRRPDARMTSTSNGSILVATDGHEQSDGALRAALSLLAPHATCYLVAVLPPLPIVTPEAQLAITSEFLAGRRFDLHRDIEAQLARVAPAPEAKITVEILDGDPAISIARLARSLRPRLIIAGLGRHKLVDRLFGAETTMSLMRRASVPVLAVGPSFTGAPQQIVVGMDFSEPSVRATRHALSIAGPGATINLVHVGPAVVRATTWEQWGTEYERSARVTMTKMQSRLNVPSGVTINPVFLRGDAAAELLGYAALVGADLIATGSHGHGFVARMLIGSVAARIVRATTVPLLTVPHMIALRDAGDGTMPSALMLLPRDHWDIRLDEFTRRNLGRPVVLEVDDPDLGARAQEHGYPLAGATFDRHDHQVHVMLGKVGDRKHHLTRSIANVTSMDVISDGQGHDLGLRIAHGAGETIVTFTR